MTSNVRVRRGVIGSSVVGGRAQLADGRARVASERAQLVADDRRRLAQERPHLDRASGRARARTAAAPPTSRRAGWRASSSWSASSRACCSVGGSSRSAAWMFVVSGSANALKFAFEESTNSASCVSFLPSSSVSRPEVVDHAPEVLAPLLELRGDQLGVARGRLEALERLAQVGRDLLAAERLAAGGEQDHQVVARVGVERREDLVEVDVGRRLRDRDASRPP